MPLVETCDLQGNLGANLFYPCAGSDTAEAIGVFRPYAEELWFSDTRYGRLSALLPTAPDEGWQVIETEIRGPDSSEFRQGDPSRGTYANVDPGILRETMRHAESGRRIVVNRRRGFGQYALAGFPDRSIGVFMHRGDSGGESGSNVFFLGNRERRHEPVSNLWDTLSRKLSDVALVVSDGSNTRFGFLRRFRRPGAHPREAYESLKDGTWDHGGFRWRCIGYMSPRNGPTLVWRIERLAP